MTAESSPVAVAAVLIAVLWMGFTFGWSAWVVGLAIVVFVMFIWVLQVPDGAKESKDLLLVRAQLIMADIRLKNAEARKIELENGEDSQ